MPAPSFDVSVWSALHLNRVERALERWIPQSAPAGLAESMRYAVLDGGKRLRPLLVMGAREAVATPRRSRQPRRPCSRMQPCVPLALWS